MQTLRNDPQAAQTVFWTLEGAALQQAQIRLPKEQLGCNPQGIKVTFVPPAQAAAVVLTKGLGSHGTDEFRAFLENKELPPAIALARTSQGKEASIGAAGGEDGSKGSSSQTSAPPRAHASHPIASTCPC